MKRSVLLLAGVILLYLLPSLVLQAVYGPSYGFLSGEDYWEPDGAGGWKAHGEPGDPPPSEPSVNVPLGVRYVPIFLPAELLFLFLFTPLSRHVDTVEPEGEAVAEEVAGEPSDDPEKPGQDPPVS